MFLEKLKSNVGDEKDQHSGNTPRYMADSETPSADILQGRATESKKKKSKSRFRFLFNFGGRKHQRAQSTDV